MRSPGRRHLVRDHHQRMAGVLCVVPGVEELFLIAVLSLVEQPAAYPLDEAASEQSAAGAPRSGQDRRLDRPHAPAAEMLEGLPIRVGDDEAEVALALRPVEWKRDLVGTALHYSSPALFVAGCGGGVAAGGCTGGGGSAGGLSELAWILTTVPEKSTIQPRPLSAAASWAMVPR